MIRSNVSKGMILDFAKEVKARFRVNDEDERQLMMRGLQLYRQGNVYNVDLGSAYAEASIIDEKTYDAGIDLESIDGGYCDCLELEFCEHRLALFFSVYAGVDRVGNFLDDWKSSGITLGKFNLTPANINHEQQSLQSWLQVFDVRYEVFRHSQTYFDPYFASSIYHKYFWALKTEAPKSQELKRFYIIHAALSAFLKIIAEYNRRDFPPYYNVEANVKTYMQHLIDVISDELMPLRSTILPFSLDPLVKDSVERIRDVLAEDDQFQYERFLLYETFWSATFPQNTLRKAEKEKLKALQEEKKNGLIQLARCHLAFLDRDDEKVISLFEQLSPLPLHFSFDWMKMLADSNQWKRFAIWSEFTTEKIKEYIDNLGDYSTKRSMTRYFLRLLDHVELDQKKYVEALEILMPYSSLEYSEHLFEAKNYRCWVELQLLLHAEANNFDRKMLKAIEDEDRASLLPLYHFSVTKALSERNRQSYKQAVRYLKKLRAHYKKLKKQREWELYLKRLVEANKRLRAFMEELQKGKLLDA